MDDLLAEFIEETRETLAPLGREIVAWEAAPADRARLDSIFRFVHTVKGSCGFLDLPRLERLSHVAESALAAVREGERTPDRALVDAVLAIIDRIGVIVEALAGGNAVVEDGDEGLILALEPAGKTPVVPVVAVVEPGPEAGLVSRAATRSIRLPVDLLDRVMAGVSDMVLARNELSRRLRDRSGGDADVDTAFERLSNCVAEMREAITRTRMSRIDGLFAALPRMVRDLSAELGKQVRLVVDGGDVELDREMIEVIRDPLTHIVRNAIDHGIEAPADRAAAGKPVAGTLRVEARQSGNHILIEIVDDGHGIDEVRLVDKAIAAGLIDRDAATRMPRAARIDLVFAAGLSTAAQVSAISGRGVGMDVVRANVERIGGDVRVTSELGMGCRLTLRVPMTLTIIPALTFASGGALFAIPRSAIDEITRAWCGSVAIERIGGAAMARIRGERLPVVELAPLLGLTAAVPAAQSILVVVRALSGERYALAVDEVRDHEELVVKPAAPAIMATGVYAGTTLPDNGRPMLLIDPAGIAQVAGVRAGADEARALAVAPAEPGEALLPTLVFHCIDGTPRCVRLALVERIFDVPADAVAVAAGRLGFVHEGRVVPLFGCAGTPDAAAVRVLMLGDGLTEVGYAIRDVVDIHDLGPAVVPAAAAGPVAGALLVDGRQIELIDPFWHFAAAAGSSPAAAGVTRPLCMLGDDPWMRDVLRPIVEQAGYRVGFVGETPDAPPFATIVSGETAAATAATGAAPVIRLSATPGTAAGSVYRYDRPALEAALAAIGGR